MTDNPEEAANCQEHQDADGNNNADHADHNAQSLNEHHEELAEQFQQIVQFTTFFVILEKPEHVTLPHTMEQMLHTQLDQTVRLSV